MSENTVLQTQVKLKPFHSIMHTIFNSLGSQDKNNNLYCHLGMNIQGFLFSRINEIFIRTIILVLIILADADVYSSLLLLLPRSL
jgi:hypothetical protein